MVTYLEIDLYILRIILAQRAPSQMRRIIDNHLGRANVLLNHRQDIREPLIVRQIHRVRRDLRRWCCLGHSRSVHQRYLAEPLRSEVLPRRRRYPGQGLG